MAILKTRGSRKAKDKLHDAVVPQSIIEHTKSFTGPRGRMEMGGLLFGHVDSRGRNVCVVGFFPRQSQSTPTYCEFEGKWMAIGAAAADTANQVNAGKGVPNIRVIGWIHTHPDLGIFLSGTDVNTFRQNKEFSPDGRFIAIVVDPLRSESGVFNTPDERNVYSKPKGKLDLDADLEERYLIFLEQLEDVRNRLGKEDLPFIITGDLHNKHVSRGNPDDFMDNNLFAIHLLKKRVNMLEDQIGNLMSEPNAKLGQQIQLVEQQLGQQLQLVEEDNSARASIVDEEIERIRAGIDSIPGTIEGELSKFKDEVERKLLDNKTMPSRNSEILDSIKLSIRDRGSRMDELEKLLDENREFSTHTHRSVLEIGGVLKDVPIHSKAIQQLKKSIFEIPSQLKANSDSSRNMEKQEWHDFWETLNVKDVTIKQVLGEHIGLIGTNHDVAMPVIRMMLGRDVFSMQEQKKPLSTRVVREVDRASAKAAVSLWKKAVVAKEWLTQLSTRVVREVERASAKAAVFLGKKASENE